MYGPTRTRENQLNRNRRSTMNAMKWMTPLALASALVACGDSTEESANNNPDSQTAMLELESSDLPALGAEYVYEGWVMVDGSPVTTGRFTVEEAGGVSQSFEVDAATLGSATKFVLTIEPATGDDPAPSAVKFLGGDIVDGETIARISDAAALGTDFGDASGGYILAAPSAEMGTATYANGVWFLDPDAGPGASLDLPSLPEGWTYEGWVVTDTGPVSTGRFADPSAADSDGAGPDAGPNGTPPFPGQDFVVDGAQIDLLGKTVVVSVEPMPDDSPAPFILKPLVDGSVEDVGAMTVQSLESMDSAPELGVTIQ
jgi:hypothetical protein